MNLVYVEFRNALVCVAVALIALLLAWPFSTLPFNDDWTWALTVLNLSRSGHLMYNGWSSPPVIAQAYWGWLWVALFGFSFNVLKLSGWPSAMGAVGLCYLLGRRVGLTTGMSIFVAMLLGLSPIFMPLESSFMTDVPGLFFMLVSMIALLRGFETESEIGASGLLFLGAVSALVGGSSRQLVWIVPLVVLPYFAWLRRRDRIYVIASVCGWLVVFIGAAAMQHWFARQPYALPDPPLPSYLSAIKHHPKQFGIGVISLLLTMVMVLLPAAVGVVRRRVGAVELLGAVLFAAGVLALRRLHHLRTPWMGNLFTTSGPLSSVEVAGGRPVVLGSSLRLGLSLVVIAAGSLLLAQAIFWAWGQGRGLLRRSLEFFLKPSSSETGVSALLLVALAMFALELTRVASGVSYDRHLLPFIPFVAVPLLGVYQRGGRKIMPIASWMLLAVYGGYAVACTQEVNALARARGTAIQRLESTGIAANQIEGGFEHNYWTEALIDGHINDPRIRVPAGAYRSDKGPTPGMQMLYRLESGPTAVTTPTEFGQVSYLSFLPPFHRKIYIDRFTDPWWLNPVKAATRPADRSLLPGILLEQYGSKYSG